MKGERAEPSTLQGLVGYLSAFVSEQTTRHGSNAHCNLFPISYDIGDGRAINIWYLVHPLTWGELGSVLRGLQLYIIDGRRNKSFRFDIHDKENFDIYTHIGRGEIGTWPRGTFGQPSIGDGLLSEIRKHSRRALIREPPSKRALRISPANVAEESPVFDIPGSQLKLVLHDRGSVPIGHVRTALFTAETRVGRKISESNNNKDAPGPFIFDHKEGVKPLTRLVIWSSLPGPLTWGQLGTIIEGLQVCLVYGDAFEYTRFEIFDGSLTKRSQIGWGAILECDFALPPASLASLSLNPSSKRALPILPGLDPVTLNLSNVSAR